MNSSGDSWRLDRATVLKAAGAVLGVSLLSLLFIGSYAAALHEPKPHEVPIAVDDAVPPQASAKLDASPALEVKAVAGAEAVEKSIDDRDSYGGLVAVGPGRLELIVAPAAGAAVADFLTAAIPPQLEAAGATVSVSTVHELPTTDARGLVGFYTVVGWSVAGYLGATLLGLAFGTGPTRARTAWRFVALGALGVVVGIGGAGLATAIAGYDHGVAALALIGFLTVLAIGSITVALQSLIGILGTGVAILLFVVFGNPAAGGPYAPQLLPGIWRVGGQLIPTGAGTSGVRDAAYFPSASLWPQLLCLLIWIAVGVGVALLAGRRGHGMDEAETKASLAGVG